MDSLFNRWKTKIPNYSSEFKFLFDRLSSKGGTEGAKKISLGKHFSTNYELYIYAFFLGLYEEEYSPIPKDKKKLKFSHHIQHWGSKSNKIGRKDFSRIQEYIFTALVAKTDINLIDLDKGIISEKEVIQELLLTLEAYTNGGLTLIKEKLEDNPNYYLQPTSFLDMIMVNIR